MSAEQIKNLDKPRPLKHKSKSDSIVNIVFKMMLDGYSKNDIRRYLKNNTNVSDNIITHCMDAVAYNNFPTKEIVEKYGYIRRPDGAIVIHRSAILKYLLSVNPNATGPDSSKARDGKIGWWLRLIEKKYSSISLVRTIASEFYSIITGNNPQKIDEFIEKYAPKEKNKSSKFKKTYAQKVIESFCNGLKQDIDAVKNSIIYKAVSSGPVEGCNNKFKLVKRESYGRSKHQNLSKKSILAFSNKVKGFNVKELVSVGKTAGFTMSYNRRQS